VGGREKEVSLVGGKKCTSTGQERPHRSYKKRGETGRCLYFTKGDREMTSRPKAR